MAAGGVLAPGQDMREEQWRAAWDLFEAGGDLPPDELQAFLNHSGVSPEVRRIADRMMVAAESPSSDSGITASPQPAISLLTAGSEIGRYLLAEKIGEGGMGEVWLAEQRQPVRRRVALKLIKGGLGSREVIARFESERQALALMDHPGIAKVFDAGSTPQGAPYFVMEYAEGQPITTYCDERRLNTRQRFESVHQCLRGRGTRSPQGDHSPRSEAFQHPGDRPGRARRA